MPALTSDLGLGRTGATAVPAVPSEREAFFFELRELLALLRRRVAWIVTAMAICAVGALAVIATARPMYSSTAQIMLDPRGLNVVGTQVVPQPPSADVNDAVIDTETGLLTSDAVLDAVVSACDLQDDPDFVGRPGLLRRIFSRTGGRDDEATRRAIAASELRRRLTIQRNGKSFIVNISVKAGDPNKAARIARATATAFFDALVKQRRDVVVRAQGAMRSTLEGQRNRVADAETAVERYKASAGIFDADGRVLNTQRLAELDAQRQAARNAVSTLAARLEQLDRLKQSPDKTQTFDSPVLAQLRTSRADAARQAANLRATLGARHPQLREVDAQIQSLDRAILQEVGRLTASTQSDYRAAQARAQALDADRQQLELRVTTLNADLPGLHELEREAEAQRSVYEKFLARERELREQETISPVNASLVTDPTASSTPVGLRPPLLLVAALALGALVGAGLAWAYEFWSGRVFSAGRLQARTGLTLLGTAPIERLPPSDGADMACILARGRGNASSRALYQVAGLLDRMGGGEAPALLVAATSPGGGGSLVSANVALVEAERGRGTLLIETLEGQDAVPALSRVMAGAGDVASCAVEGYPGFSAARFDPGLSGTSRETLRQAWARTFDRIVVNVGADTDQSATRWLADTASLIVVVVEDSVTRYAEIEALLDTLSANGRKIAGAILVGHGADPVRSLAVRTALIRPVAARTAPVRVRAGSRP